MRTQDVVGIITCFVIVTLLMVILHSKQMEKLNQIEAKIIGKGE